MKFSFLILFLNISLSSSDNFEDKLMEFEQLRLGGFLEYVRFFNDKPERLTNYTDLLKENVDYLNYKIFEFIMKNETAKALKFFAPDFIYIERGTPETVSRKYGTQYKIFEEVHTSINPDHQYPRSSIFINDSAIDKNEFAWNIAKHLTKGYEKCIRYKNRELLSKFLKTPYQITFTDHWRNIHVQEYPNHEMVNSYVQVNGKVPIGSFIITRAILHSNWSVEFDAHYNHLRNTFLAETAWHGYMIVSEIQNAVVVHSKPVFDGLNLMEGNYKYIFDIG
ncbi:unnamed protein product [Caenorhabditis angaria]|uniref:Glycosyltransferase family 92 protein n=1 Tax=Caenorhabditis angaria TaxID=860376 RepID=A0A9P1N7L6_9PELO|nr:unnamed protein product [Caenorhabditis angaria]